MTGLPRSADPTTSPRRRGLTVLVGAAVLVLSAPVGAALVPELTAVSAASSYRAALTTAARASGDRALIETYAARGFQPVWFDQSRPRPEAIRLIAVLARAGTEGLDPARYEAAALARAVRPRDGAEPFDVAATDVRLTRAYARYLSDLRRPKLDAPYLVDAELAPEVPSYPELLGSRDRPLDSAMTQALEVNPIYADLRRALARHRADPRPVDGLAPSEVEALILVNLERARALPATPGDRYALVDIAAGELELYDRNQIARRMKVAVGRPDMATPVMAGLIRHAVLNPYWNVPPDLARDRYATRALADPAVLEREGFEVMSDWSPTASRVSPDQVDWASVVTGDAKVRLRQTPGPANMMGRVKFMLPNRLGIYLHDTPDKAVFDLQERAISAGCVRVEDADQLSRWLFGREMRAEQGGSETMVDLPAPVPVYMLYLTARADGGQLALRPDIYDRDRAAIQRLRTLRGAPFQRS